MKKPKISVIICTYNSPKLVKNCIDSIFSQDFKDFEVICVDGMSSDNTREVIKSYSKKDKRVKLLINKKRFPEGKGFGKWQGYSKAKGDVIAFIDQDNILQRSDLFSKAIKILNSNSNNLGVLAGLKNDLKDNKVVRFVSLVGTDAFFAYRSIDFLRNLNPSKKGLEKIEMNLDNMPLTGGNCFFYFKKSLEKIGGYSKDVLVVKRLIENSNNQLFILKNSTKHYAEKNLISLIKKKFTWASKYRNSKNEEQFNYLPQTKKERHFFLKNLGFNLLIIPNLIYSLKIYSNKKDPIIFIFPFMAFINTIAYLSNFIKEKINNWHN